MQRCRHRLFFCLQQPRRRVWALFATNIFLHFMNEQAVPRCSQTADALLCLPAHTPVHSGIRSSADRAMMVAAGTTDRLLDLNLSDVQNVNRSVSPNAPPGTAPRDCASQGCGRSRLLCLSPLALWTATNVSRDWISSDWIPGILLWTFKGNLKKTAWTVDCSGCCLPSDTTFHSNPWQLPPRYKNPLETLVVDSNHLASGGAQGCVIAGEKKWWNPLTKNIHNSSAESV